MTDLVDFLLARIAEDEHLAKDAGYGRREWRSEIIPVNGQHAMIGRNTHPDLNPNPIDLFPTGDVDHFTVEHIARWDPARVLAECEAKRKIVKWATEWPMRPSRPSDEDAILRPLAVLYADHPDYRVEWRP